MARIQRSVGRDGRNLPEDVRTVQNLLNRHVGRLSPLGSLTVNGTCGHQMTEAIEMFQRRVLRMRRPDGRVDPRGRTLRMLSQPSAEEIMRRYHYPVGPQEPLADIAVPYIGATEARGNRMGNDLRMREIFSADWLSTAGVTDGYPWCCSFVSMCTQKLIRQHSGFFGHLRPPRTASVSGYRTRWAPANHCLLFPPDSTYYHPHKGDVVIFTFSHIGIVRAVQDDGVRTIEGNTNARGSREGTTVKGWKLRKWHKIRCFIRFPVPIEYDTTNGMCRSNVASSLMDGPMSSIDA